MALGLNGFGKLGSSNITNRLQITVQIGTGNNWNQIFVGNYSSFAIQSNGTLWTWGLNSNGKLGLNTTVILYSQVQSGASLWREILPGFFGSLGLQYDGTLWDWGGNSYSRLGLNTFGTNIINIYQSRSSSDCGKKLLEIFIVFMPIQTNGTLWATRKQYFITIRK
jgi:hypothetical protein